MAGIGLGSADAQTVINVVPPTAVTISGTPAGTTITLNQTSNPFTGTYVNNVSFPGNDLIFVAGGGTLTAQNGSGSLNLTLASTNGAVDIAQTGVNGSTATGTATITATVSGSVGLLKTGAGRLTLSGADNYTGGTTIAQGTLALNFAATGAPTSNIISNNVPTGSSLTFGSSFSGAGSIGQSFPTLLVQAGAAGATQSFSSLNLTQGSAIVIAQGNGTSNAIVNFGSISQTSGGSVNFTRATNGGAGVGAFTTSQSNDATGILGGWAVINATPGTSSALQLSTDWAAVSNGTIVPYASTNYTPLSSGALNTPPFIVPNGTNNNVKIDATTDQTIALGNETSGSTTIGFASTTGLVAGAGITGGALPNNTTIVSVTPTSIVVSSAPTATSATASFTYAPATYLSSSGTTDINTLLISDPLGRVVDLTTSPSAGATTGTAGTLRLGANGGIMTAAGAGPAIIGGLIGGASTAVGTLTAGGTSGGPGQINLQLNQQLTINSTISNNTNGAVSLNVNTYNGTVSSSALILTAANTYSGGTFINSGRVQANNSQALGTGLVTIEPEGQLFAQNQGTITNSFALSGAGGANYDTASALRLNSTTVSGAITLLSDATITGRGGAITGNVSGNYSLTFGRPAGANGASLSNFTFSNANGSMDTYTGGTILTEGSVILNSNNVIPTGSGYGNVVLTQPFSNNPTSLDLHGTSQTINGLIGTSGINVGTVTNTNFGSNASVLAVGNSNTSSTFNGTITDGGQYRTLALTKIGGGTLTLGGTNSYGGATTVSGGTLALASTSTITATSAINTNGGTLLFGATNQIQGIATSAAVNLAGGGLSLQGQSGISETLGALTLTANSTIDFGTGNSNTLTFSKLSIAAGVILTVADWTGSIYSGMTMDNQSSNPAQDRLLFTDLSSLPPGALSQINFYGDNGAYIGNGAQVVFNPTGGGTSSPEVVPVPEPSTLSAGLGLLGLLLWNWLRRRSLLSETQAQA